VHVQAAALGVTAKDRCSRVTAAFLAPRPPGRTSLPKALMKRSTLPLWLIALAGVAFSQTTETAATGQPEILGQIPDGTPTAATPEPEPYEVKPEDIVSTTVTQDGDQTITVHQIKPIDLPPPPEPAPAPTPQSLSAFQQRLAQRQALPRPQPLHLSATVYRSAASAPRTHVRVWTQDATPITFWSSADFALIAGIQNFTDSQGGTHQLFLGWGNADLDLLRQRHATGLSPTPAPDIPSLPEGTATFTLTSGTPDAATLSALQALHELYQREYPRLLEAWQGRETARLQAAEAAKNPPPPEKDITIHYWRTEEPAAPAAQGGAQ